MPTSKEQDQTSADVEQLGLFGMDGSIPEPEPATVAQRPAAQADTAAARPTTPETDPSVTATVPVASYVRAADGHAIIVTSRGVWSPSGARVADPLTSTADLAALLDTVALSPAGASAQVWLMGEVADTIGWSFDVDALSEVPRGQHQEQGAILLAEAITATLQPLQARGWQVAGTPGHRTHLKRTVDRSTQMLDLIVDAWAWLIPTGRGNTDAQLGVLGTESNDPNRSTALPDDERGAARELARRLAWCVAHLGVLPGATGARTGAAVSDSITRARKRTQRGVVVTKAGPVPQLNPAPHGRELEDVLNWTRPVTEDDLAGVDRLITVDQRAAYLASAGMLYFGYGDPRRVQETAAATAARDGKRTPFGLWRVTLPAGASLALPDRLPLPHPRMAHDRPADAWITSESLDGLRRPVVDGGAGLDLDDLDIAQAWLWPEQAKVLEAWAKRLREARAAAEGDPAMRELVRASYAAYVGRMTKPELWAASLAQHHQPVWRASIIAHCRWRGRREAMRIAGATGRWPLRAATDSWTYAVGAAQQITTDSTALGKLREEKSTPLTDTVRAQLAAASTAEQTRRIITTALGVSGEDADSGGVDG